MEFHYIILSLNLLYHMSFFFIVRVSTIICSVNFSPQIIHLQHLGLISVTSEKLLAPWSFHTESRQMHWHFAEESCWRSHEYEKELVSCGHWPRERAATIAAAAKHKYSLQTLTRCSAKGNNNKTKTKYRNKLNTE